MSEVHREPAGRDVLKRLGWSLRQIAKEMELRKKLGWPTLKSVFSGKPQRGTP